MKRRFKSSTRAMSLIELGVVMGCVAILASIVFTAIGFIVDAETKATLAKIASLKKATHTWSKRRRAGHGFGGDPYAAEIISIQSLIFEGLIQDEDPAATTNVWTAWGTDVPPIGIKPSGPTMPGIGSTQFTMTLCTPTVETAEDFERMMGDIAVSHLRRPGGGCPCATCVFEMIME